MARQMEYKVITCRPNETASLERDINKAATEGFRVIAYQSPNAWDTVIMEREARRG